MRPSVAACVVVPLLVATLGLRLSSQAPAKVDFARDVQPILSARCVGCHGPVMQQAGYRLDRRSGALSGTIRPNIIPGSSGSSRLYQRLVNSYAGPQMPPTGALPPDEIGVLKQWIDEGAEWPLALANEVERPAESPRASRLIDMLRSGDRKTALAQVAEEPAIVNGRGPGGQTLLMATALYGEVDTLAAMVKAGGDVNARNDAGASALMWALDDIDKVRVLLDRGAEANVTSAFGKTPLELAIYVPSPTAVVALLLERGAIPNQAALTAAARLGTVDIVRLLVAAGARDTGAAALAAVRANCRDCLDAIADGKPLAPIRGAVAGVLPPIGGQGHSQLVRQAIERGGDVNLRDGKLRTPLMRAAISEAITPESMQSLIEHGAEVNAKTPEGRTALFFAKRLGATPIVAALEKAGATSESEPPAPLTVVNANNVREAIQRSVPLLQRTGIEFYRKSGCVSCHHNTLTAMTVAALRAKGFTVDEGSAREDLASVIADVRATRDQALQGIVTPGGGVTTTGYILIGLNAERHQPDPGTDALVRLLRLSQRADGLWDSVFRPPMEGSEITATAVSLRGVRLYGREQDRQRNEQVVRAARVALEKATPIDTEDRVFRLLGLTWGNASREIQQSARHDLLATQRADGGWAQLPLLPSDAYATGSALVALHESGVQPDEPPYRRGVEYLLQTQLTDGSWFVRTRTLPTQIYRESGFPHGEHQFISAAATNWATQALAIAHQK